MTSERCRAFTLIELIIVIGIMMVSAGLLLAAVQNVRESANRAACANNLHQIALAAHGYQDLNGSLPANYAEDAARTDGSHNLFYGPMVPLLPYLESTDVYRNFSFLYYDSSFPQGTSGVTWPGSGMDWINHTWLSNPFNRPPLQTIGFVPPPNQLGCPNPTGSTNIPGQTWGDQGNLRVFACPSQPADHSQANQGSAYILFLYGMPTVDMPPGNPFWDNPSYPTCSDDNNVPPGAGCTDGKVASLPDSYVVGRSDYVAVVGAFHDTLFDPRLTNAFVDKYRSLFSYPLLGNLASVPDGTSNTLMFSEFCGQFFADHARQPQLVGWVTASWTCNGVSVASGTCPDPANDLAWGGSCEYGPKGAGLGAGPALGGWHHGRFNVAFADGSVRALPLGIDKALLFSLAGYSDGDPLVGADF
jgi:prepilin-type processing-associated H-X9-DG protein